MTGTRLQLRLQPGELWGRPFQQESLQTRDSEREVQQRLRLPQARRQGPVCPAGAPGPLAMLRDAGSQVGDGEESVRRPPASQARLAAAPAVFLRPLGKIYCCHNLCLNCVQWMVWILVTTVYCFWRGSIRWRRLVLNVFGCHRFINLS